MSSEQLTVNSEQCTVLSHSVHCLLFLTLKLNMVVFMLRAMLNFLVNEDVEEAFIRQIQNHIQSKPQQYFYNAGFSDLINR